MQDQAVQMLYQCAAGRVQEKDHAPPTAEIGQNEDLIVIDRTTVIIVNIVNVEVMTGGGVEAEAESVMAMRNAEGEISSRLFLYFASPFRSRICCKY
jgi:hypothetical protein